MTEEEFKITIRAFFPTIAFFTDDCEDDCEKLHIVESTYFYHDKFGMGDRFKFVCDARGEVAVLYGVLPLNIDSHPKVLADIVRNMKHNGWYLLYDHFMNGVKK